MNKLLEHLHRPVRCYFCSQVMYYRGQPEHVPEVRVTVLQDQDLEETFYAHLVCWNLTCREGQPKLVTPVKRITRQRRSRTMKIYRCTKSDAGLGTLLSWHASKREADAELRRFQKERGESPTGSEGVDAVNLPTDQVGLLTWLNAHFDCDNG